MSSGAAGHSVHGCACLEVAYGNDLLSLPDLVGEGVGSPPVESVGVVIEEVKRGNHTAAPDLDKAVVEEISRKLAG